MEFQLRRTDNITFRNMDCTVAPMFAFQGNIKNESYLVQSNSLPLSESFKTFQNVLAVFDFNN